MSLSFDPNCNPFQNLKPTPFTGPNEHRSQQQETLTNRANKRRRSSQFVAEVTVKDIEEPKPAQPAPALAPSSLNSTGTESAIPAFFTNGLSFDEDAIRKKFTDSLKDIEEPQPAQPAPALAPSALNSTGTESAIPTFFTYGISFDEDAIRKLFTDSLKDIEEPKPAQPAPALAPSSLSSTGTESAIPTFFTNGISFDEDAIRKLVSDSLKDTEERKPAQPAPALAPSSWNSTGTESAIPTFFTNGLSFDEDAIRKKFTDSLKDIEPAQPTQLVPVLARSSLKSTGFESPIPDYVYPNFFTKRVHLENAIRQLANGQFP